MSRWIGISALVHIVLAVALFAASFGSSLGPPSQVSERVITVRLIGDDRGERTARPAEPRGIKSPQPPFPKGGPNGGNDIPSPLPSPLAGEGQGGGSLRLEPEHTASVATSSGAPSTADGNGASTEERIEQNGDDAETREEASPEAAGATGVASEDAYRPLVLAALARAKRYPLLARQRGLEGVVEIAFTIHPDGRVSSVEVVNPSRHRLLDAAALGMVDRIGSLPPPPSSAPLRFPARIEYRLTAERDVIEHTGPAVASSSFSIVHHKESSP
jgi:TonB family protein